MAAQTPVGRSLRWSAGRRELPSAGEAELVKNRGQSYAKTLPRPRKVQVVDFFSGCGGLSWGFETTRQSDVAFEVLAGIDIDAMALETYRMNIDAQTVLHDVRAIGNHPEVLKSLIPRFDPNLRPFVFIGAPPCQGFSAHRKKDPRDDPRNSLVTSFAKICSFWQPDAVVIENVPEMVRGRHERYYIAARRILIETGYSIAEDVLDLSGFGVPQRRRRSIVIANLGQPATLPVPILPPGEVRTVRDAIGHLAPLKAGQVDQNDPWHRSPAHIKRIVDLIKSIPPDGGDRRALPEEAQLECHRDLDKSDTPGFSDVYGRLRWDTPSVTITAKSSTPSCGRFVHPKQHRNISLREAALLQGFPHNFVFAGPFVNQYRQVGEAVPPLFARFLASHLLQCLYPKSSSAVRVRRSVERQQSKTPTALAKRNRLLSVDIFCGAGGFSLGLAAAGLQHVLGVDIDSDAVDTFAKNVSGDVLCRDVRSELVRNELETQCAGRRFIIAGGPPCQGFSQQRRGRDDDDRNDLVIEYARLVTSLSARPLGVVLENVMYLDSPRGREICAEFVSKLEAHGYVVFRHDLNSAEFGVPQLRRRIVLVALDASVAHRYKGPKPFTAHNYPTIGDVLAGLSSEPKGEPPNHIASVERPINVQRIAYVDMGRGRTAIPSHLQLSCHRSYDGHLDVYGRLDWFGQARTITGGFDSASRGEYSHPFRNRSITAREAARIQGFPDWFTFEGNRAAVRRQIGNAVPPPMAYAIGKALLDVVG